MEMRKCMKGHYYDASLHADCPYCKRRNEGWMTASADVEAAYCLEDDERTLPLGYIPMAPPLRMAAAMPRENEGLDADDRTVLLTQQNMGTNPVVGWLVCTEGREKGKDYRLHRNHNFIGRNGEMDISVPWDETISYEKHAVVSYDSLNQTYHVSQGNGGGNVSLNGRALLKPARLEAYDEIMVGQTKFLFIPLCGEKFDWIGGKQ
ncbi:MAG: FHA domain-containing protein [bacterium]|nr:FHA domain-containing protein [bacterium]